MSDPRCAMKVLAVCGTRPDAVKMAPVVIELKRHPQEVDLVFAVNGQHREKLSQVLNAFELQYGVFLLELPGLSHR